MATGKFYFCTLQETKINSFSPKWVPGIWRDANGNWVAKPVEGLSGRLLYLWSQDLLNVHSLSLELALLVSVLFGSFLPVTWKGRKNCGGIKTTISTRRTMRRG